MESLINWGLLQKMGPASNPGIAGHDAESTENMAKLASSFDHLAGFGTQYTTNQCNSLPLSTADSVLVVGCGSGRLALPIAKRVKKLTAFDASERMLAVCKDNARKAEQDNIIFRRLDWSLPEPGKQGEKFDVVITTRSVGIEDIKRLNILSRKYVFVIYPYDYPSLKDIQHEMLLDVRGRISREEEAKSQRIYGYNTIFNMLYDLGLDPVMSLLNDGFERIYMTREDAYQDLRKIALMSLEDFDNPLLDEDEDKIFRTNLEPYFSLEEDGKVKFFRESKTMVIGWKAKEI
ncbi:MAG: class I SAM-dependent methyltransferase [Youngiibacter sp.]|nr:class I SAM-dependent methyltransferase [Youngiibacter sp.]